MKSVSFKTGFIEVKAKEKKTYPEGGVVKSQKNGLISINIQRKSYLCSVS